MIVKNIVLTKNWFAVQTMSFQRTIIFLSVITFKVILGFLFRQGSIVVRAKLGKQLQLTLTLFLLRILWNLLVFRKCLSISFSPSFSMNMETHIGKTFLKLIDKYFPKTNKFHKIFNRNNVKVSYSCLLNFANIIKSHNNRILSEEKTQDQPKCNC